MNEQKRAMRQERHGIWLDDAGFEVRHRNVTFGPFRTRWALDLSAMELTFRAEQVAAVGVQPCVYADFTDTGLPQRVRQIATIVFAAIHEGVQRGLPESQRPEVVRNTLADHGLERFRVFEPDRNSV